jgi:hypothetical protein
METRHISGRKRTELLEALRRGTVPNKGLAELAVGLDHFVPTVDELLDHVAAGHAAFKAVRGDYGCGKTFFSRWLEEKARARNFACCEIQISETETPLHRLETVYRRMMERLSVPGTDSGAFRQVIDGWFFALEEELIADNPSTSLSEQGLLSATTELMEKRLGEVARVRPQFASVLRAYRRALAEGDLPTAEGLLSWLSGQPNVAASIKAKANIKGEVDHFAALGFLQGFLRVLRDSSYSGLLVILDELETLQRVRSDVRDKSLNALRQLIDELDGGRFPGLFLVITGTPSFFDGPQGVKKLPPLAQRLHTDFDTESRFDNPRAPQLRLMPFVEPALLEVGRKVRDIFATGSPQQTRILAVADDELIAALARGVTGRLGGHVGLAPRLFLKKLVADVLDRIEQFADFDPRRHYKPVIGNVELNEAEQAVAAPISIEEISLEW